MKPNTYLKPGRKIGLALLILWLSAIACALPVVGPGAVATPTSKPTTPVPSTPVVLATTAPAATATENPPIAPEEGEVVIYMIALEDNGLSGPSVGCGDSLIPVHRMIAPTSQPIVAALNELFSVKSQYYGESGLYNALWQSNLEVASATVDANGMATVQLTGSYMLGGVCDVPRFKAQIEQTILSIGGVKAMNVFLNGRQIDEALSLK